MGARGRLAPGAGGADPSRIAIGYHGRGGHGGARETGMTHQRTTRARPGPSRPALRAGVAALLLGLLVACDSPEEQEAKYLARGIALFEEGSNPKAMVEFRNVLRINPKNAEAIYRVGLIHERAQRWQQAFAAFQAAVAEQPGMVPAHVKLATLALTAGEIGFAETAAAAIEKARPDHPDALAIRGAVALRQARHQDALELARRALAQDQDHENAIAVEVGVLQKLGESGRAVAALDAAIARRPQNPALRLLKVNLLEQAGDPEAVRAAYDDLIAFDPTNETYRLALANFLQQRADVAGAERVLRQALDGDRATARTTTFLIQLLYRSQGFAAAAAELRRQIERAPDDHTLRFLLAELNTRERRFEAAEAELRTIVGRAGASTSTGQDAEAGIAQLALAQGQVDRARQAAEGVIKANGEHRGANLIAGLVALQQNRLDDAVRNGRTALRRDPAWLPGLKLVAEAHLKRGEQDLAIGALNEVVTLDPGDAQAAQVLAQLLTERRDYDSALKVWDLVLRTADAPAEKGQALRSRAQIAIRQQNWTQAQADIQQLLEIPEGQAVGALLAGDLMIAQNRIDQARRSFEEARKIAPDAPEPVIGVVRTYLAAGDVAGAVAYLEAHTRARPEDPIAFNMLGELAARQGDVAAAKAGFGRASELQPQWATPRRQLGAFLARAGRVEEAIATYEAAIAAIPGNADLLNDLGTIMILGGRPAEAIAVYEKVLALQPESDIAINNYAALVADHRYEDRAALDRAAAMALRFRASTNPLFLDTLGWLTYRKGDYAVAASYLERAVGLAGDRPDLRYHLGMAYAKAGQSERAALELRKATAAGVPPYPGIEEARATLAGIEAAQQPRPAQGAAATGTSG
jgi:tetratricopeptide (TPR) repeat protein